MFNFISLMLFLWNIKHFCKPYVPFNKLNEFNIQDKNSFHRKYLNHAFLKYLHICFKRAAFHVKVFCCDGIRRAKRPRSYPLNPISTHRGDVRWQGPPPEARPLGVRDYRMIYAFLSLRRLQMEGFLMSVILSGLPINVEF